MTDMAEVLANVAQALRNTQLAVAVLHLLEMGGDGHEAQWQTEVDRQASCLQLERRWQSVVGVAASERSPDVHCRQYCVIWHSPAADCVVDD